MVLINVLLTIVIPPLFAYKKSNGSPCRHFNLFPLLSEPTKHLRIVLFVPQKEENVLIFVNFPPLPVVKLLGKLSLLISKETLKSILQRAFFASLHSGNFTKYLFHPETFSVQRVAS